MARASAKGKSARTRKAAPSEVQGEVASAPERKPEPKKNEGMLVNELPPIPLSALNRPNATSFVEAMKRMAEEK